MLLQVLAGALLSLVFLAVVIGLVLRRSPGVFVADKLPDRLHSGADEVDELVTGSDGLDEAGLDEGVPNEYE